MGMGYSCALRAVSRWQHHQPIAFTSMYTPGRQPPCIQVSFFPLLFVEMSRYSVWVPVVVPCRKPVRYQHQRAAECKLMYSISKCQRILQAGGFWVPIDTTGWCRPFSSHLAATRWSSFSQLVGT